MSVNGEMPFALIFPDILLVHGHAHQMRHDFRESVIVIAFHPDHFNSMTRIRKLADVAQKLPMLFGQAAEIEVAENVAQKNQALEFHGLQEMKRFPGATDFRTQVQIRDDYGVK